ncbi:MAG: hypothetical protein ACI9G1_001996 [Pirellulaceae bacterium]|jgi:hypothetical protein
MTELNPYQSPEYSNERLVRENTEQPKIDKAPQLVAG